MQNQIKITLRPEIYEKVKENSKENMRTLSEEINFILKKGYTLIDTSNPTPAPEEKPKRTMVDKEDVRIW